MKHTHGIEVSLKSPGAENSTECWAEWHNLAPGGQAGYAKACTVHLDSADPLTPFLVGVRFGRKFNMHKATALQIDIKFGTGQFLHRIHYVEPMHLFPADIELPHVFSRIRGVDSSHPSPASVGMQRVRLQMSTNAVTPDPARDAHLQLGQPRSGTMTIVITRGAVDTVSTFTPLRGNSGKPHVFEFTPVSPEIWDIQRNRPTEEPRDSDDELPASNKPVKRRGRVPQEPLASAQDDDAVVGSDDNQEAQAGMEIIHAPRVCQCLRKHKQLTEPQCAAAVRKFGARRRKEDADAPAAGEVEVDDLLAKLKSCKTCEGTRVARRDEADYVQQWQRRYPEDQIVAVPVQRGIQPAADTPADGEEGPVGIAVEAEVEDGEGEGGVPVDLEPAEQAEDDMAAGGDDGPAEMGGGDEEGGEEGAGEIPAGDGAIGGVAPAMAAVANAEAMGMAAGSARKRSSSADAPPAKVACTEQRRKARKQAELEDKVKSARLAREEGEARLRRVEWEAEAELRAFHREEEAAAEVGEEEE
ncbi:hypothetical protein LTR86_000403 [Recurvomyces mirabilis]|nr:hypothetical protein LTR86_000403 [Recurvomyces mirabilis]